MTNTMRNTDSDADRYAPMGNFDWCVDWENSTDRMDYTRKFETRSEAIEFAADLRKNHANQGISAYRVVAQ